MVVIVNCFSVLDFSGVFYLPYKVSTTVLKIGAEILEMFSRSLLSSQKLFYRTAWSTALVFLKTEQKYLN